MTKTRFMTGQKFNFMYIFYLSLIVFYIKYILQRRIYLVLYIIYIHVHNSSVQWININISKIPSYIIG